MKRRFIKLSIASALLSVSLVAALFATNVTSNGFASKLSASNAKTVTDVTSTSLTMSNGVTISATSSGFTDGSLFSLSDSGYFRTAEPIRGITSIELSYADGSAWAKIVPCYYDYDNDEVVTTSEAWPDASTSADFSSSSIDYFELYNPNGGDVVVTSMSITYSCSTSTYTFSASFTPNWNNKTAETHADIYIVGTS